MQRCKTCKWWDSEDVDRGCGVVVHNLRECQCPKLASDQLDIIEQSTGDSIFAPECEVELEDKSVAIPASSDWETFFATGSEFGCVHWKKKEINNE